MTSILVFVLYKAVYPADHGIIFFQNYYIFKNIFISISMNSEMNYVYMKDG